MASGATLGHGAALATLLFATSFAACAVALSPWSTPGESPPPLLQPVTIVSMAFMEQDDFIFIWGAKNEFWRWVVTFEGWEDLTPTDPMPWDGRVDHVRYMAALVPNRTVYVFSGEKDVFRYDIHASKRDAWSHLQAKQDCQYGEQPVFAMHQGRQALYAFGRDTWCSFDFSSNTWQGTSVVPRDMYENGFGPIAPLGSAFYIFSDKGLFIWMENDDFKAVDVKGQRPLWRERAAMVGVEDEGALYLFGGSSADGYLQDLWYFRISASGGTWTQSPASSPWPAPRASALVAAPPKGFGSKFYLLGGQPLSPPSDKTVWVCSTPDVSRVPTTTTTTTSTAGTTTTTPAGPAMSTAAWVAVVVVAAVVGFAAGFALSRLQRPARDVGTPEQVGVEMALTASRH